MNSSQTFITKSQTEYSNINHNNKMTTTSTTYHNVQQTFTPISNSSKKNNVNN